MANKYRGEVSIDLDKRRELKFTHNALVQFEEELGINSYMEWAMTLQDRKASLGTKEVRALLWCGLLHEDPTLTAAQAGELMEHAGGKEEHDNAIQQLSYIQEKVLKAFFFRALPTEAAKAFEEAIEEATTKPQKSSDSVELTDGKRSKRKRTRTA